jgi:hypothetical protein
MRLILFSLVLPMRLHLFLILVLTSCGLKNSNIETPESFKIKRHEAIEKHFEEEMMRVGKTYESQAFSQTQILKPSSYKVLDSLYMVKVNNEKIKKNDLDLEDEILLARKLAQSDTNKVIYVENHFFSVEDGDTVNFYQALIDVSSTLEIQEINLFESLEIPQKLKEFYLIYFFEESFINKGFYAEPKELAFFTYMKSGLEKTSAFERQAIVIQTLELMKLANENSTIQFNDLIRILTRMNFHGKSYAEINEEFSEIVGDVTLNEKGEECISSYQLNYAYAEDLSDGTFIQHEYKIFLDRWLRIVKIEKLTL